jgi:hypothetical protein
MQTVKSFLLICLLAVATVSYAQLEVENNGRTLFGPKAYSNGLSIVDERTGTAAAGAPFRILRSDNSSTRDNIYFTRSTTSLSTGLVMFPTGNVAIGSALPNTTSPYPLAVLQLYNTNAVAEHTLSLDWKSYYGDAIYIEKPSSMVYGSNYVIRYTGGTGTNSFLVRDDGYVTARGVQLTSDVSLKREIETLTNPLEKVMQLRGVSYYMGDNQEEKIPFDELLSYIKRTNPAITSEILKQMQAEKKRKEIGVIAQEVEKVLPEAVSTREDGLKAVSYTDLTVLLIEAVKEQQTIIDDLKLEVASLKGNQLRSSETTGLTNNLIAACSLAQNTPNPFTEQTEIKYYVAPGAKTAFICIFDMQGKMLQKLDAQAGQNSLFIEGSKLAAGMYLYSLIVDGQEVDTKKMILTK